MLCIRKRAELQTIRRRCSEASHWTLHPTSPVYFQYWFSSFPFFHPFGVLEPYEVPNTAPTFLSPPCPTWLSASPSLRGTLSPGWSPQPKTKRHSHTVGSPLPEELSLLGCQSQKDLLIIQARASQTLLGHRIPFSNAS